MKDQVAKPQLTALCLIAVAVLLAGILVIRYSGLRNGKVAASATKIQLDLISEEAAIPGKVVEARDKGIVKMKYVCTERDAAVAVFTIRDLHTGTTVPTFLLEASDQDHKAYTVDLTSASPVSYLVIRNGYAKKPEFVDVWFTPIGSKSSPVKIHLTKFSEPIRLLQPPSPLEARKSEEKAYAEMDDAVGIIDVRQNGPRMPSDPIVAHVLETTFSPWMEIYGRWPKIDEKSREETDAVKVRLDHFHMTRSSVRLTYTNARIQHINGRNILTFPVDQKVGSILGSPVQLKDLRARVLAKTPGKTPPPQEINLEVALKKSQDTSSLPVEYGPTIHLVGLTPSLVSMGIEAVRVKLYVTNHNNETGSEAITSSFNEFLKAGGVPVSNPPSEVRELQFQLRIDLPIKVSSETLILPVHHINRPHPNNAVIGSPGLAGVPSKS